MDVDRWKTRWQPESLISMSSSARSEGRPAVEGFGMS